MAQEEEAVLVCRICLESEGELVSPCPCRGSQRGVHLVCLERWQLSQQSWDMRCTTCKLRYTGYAALRLARAIWRHVQDRAESDPERLTVAIQLAHVLAEQGEFPEAAGMYRDTLEVRSAHASNPRGPFGANRLSTLVGVCQDGLHRSAGSTGL